MDFGISEPKTSPESVKLGNGVYMGMIWQGAAIGICGIFIAAITDYYEGTFAMKLHGQQMFLDDINVGADYKTKTVTISSTIDISINVSIYKL